MNYSIIVSCPRGLEAKLQEEIFAITCQNATAKKGHVSLKGNWKDIYLINLHSRLASRVLIKITQGHITSENDLYELATQINWPDYFSHDKTFRVRTEGNANWCRRFDILALKVKDAICDVFIKQYNIRPNVDKSNPDIRVSAYVNQNTAVIYLDTSGEALFKRGWRQKTDCAPIRENLAAGLLKLANYNGKQAFIDPMCGSGTIAIEAAMIASSTPPGLNRVFAFQNLNNFDSQLWKNLRAQAKSNIHPPTFQIYASDNQPNTIKKAVNNAIHANLIDYIQFDCIPFKQIRIRDKQGLLLTNPPYGQRLSELEKIQVQYAEWSKILKLNLDTWTTGFITPDFEFPKKLRLSPKQKIPVYNGQIECRLYLFDIVAGSNRKK
ncbi:MAG: class I SAM-dependent RNA methyltransferase [Neisseriaceae bacterium]|nr:MAG: class I SAM-dependent RNA methyltransferase [Neisseriaceae bacterium]